MTTFETPTPVDAHVEIGMGDITIRATDTTRTTVTVQPVRAERRADVEAAEGTTVELVGARLTITSPKLRYFGLLGRGGAVDVTVELPTGSDARATTAFGDIEARGSLRGVTLKTWAGDLRVDEADVVEARTPAGDITVGRIEARAELSTSAGEVRVDVLHGEATIRAAAGGIRLGETAGDVHAVAPYGAINLHSATSGLVSLTTSYSNIEVGIPEGTAALLDVSTDHGRIRNELTPSGSPGEEDDRVELTARTGYGSVTVRRS